MIKVSRLNGKEFFINAHMIELIEETPDTIVTMISGKKFVVSDKVSEIVDRIIDYRNNLHTEMGQESLKPFNMDE